MTVHTNPVKFLDDLQDEVLPSNLILDKHVDHVGKKEKSGAISEGDHSMTILIIIRRDGEAGARIEHNHLGLDAIHSPCVEKEDEEKNGYRLHFCLEFG